MSEVIGTTHRLSPKRVQQSSLKLLGIASASYPFRVSSEPESTISVIANKSAKRKVRILDQSRDIKCKKAMQNQPQSLKSALKGRCVSREQIKKKKMLETTIFRESGEKISVSQYLHESGFSYGSQASMICVKRVNSYMINYLVALFFRESENPLITFSLDKDVLKRFSNKWCVLKTIVKDVDSKITPENVVLSLLKQQGVAYESLIIFLDLFESSESLLSEEGQQRKYPKYEDLKYPFSKRQFMGDFIELARGGHISLEGFFETFKKPSSEELSEWERLCDCFWNDLFEFEKKKSCLAGCIVRHKGVVWDVIADHCLNSMRRQLIVVKQACPGIEKTIRIDSQDKKIYILKGEDPIENSEKDPFFIKDPNQLESLLLKELIKCMKLSGGIRNKQAFMDCFMNADLFLNGEKKTLYNFLRSDSVCGLGSLEALHIIARCVGASGGSKNKKALVACFNKPEIDLGKEKVTLYWFLISEQGGGFNPSDAIHLIAKCIGNDGGSKNKQAFVESLIKPEIDLDGKKVPLHVFLMSEPGGYLNSYEAIRVISKCIGEYGGANNKQALVESLITPENDLDGETLFNFLQSEKGCGLSVSKAIEFLAKCMGKHGGSKNKQAFLECLIRPEINLNGKRVSLYNFFISKLGGGFSIFEAIYMLIKCIGHGGGSQNKKALIDCFCKKEIKMDGKKFSIYEFLHSEEGGGFIPSESIQIIIKCIGQSGGGNNKQAFIDCFSEPQIDLDGKRVSLLKFLISKEGGNLSNFEAMQVVVKVVGNSGGAKNKQVFLTCLTKPDIEMNGEWVSFYTFLSSKQGGALNSYEAIQSIAKFIGCRGGSQNKQVLKDCFCKLEMDLEGKKVSLFTLLISCRGGNLSRPGAVLVLARCMGQAGGAKNIQALKECFSVKLLKRKGCNQSLYETLLENNVTRKEAVSLCLIFSVNRHVLSINDLLGLFNLKKERGRECSVIGTLNSLGVSCYRTLFNLVTKALSGVNNGRESRRDFFKANCQSLMDMFVKSDGFFVEKMQLYPDWSVATLGKWCVDACTLYIGKDVNNELKTIEQKIVKWISQFVDNYQLTESSVDIITHVKSLDNLSLLIELCNSEIKRSQKNWLSNDYYEECLKAGLQILTEHSHLTVQAILKYESMLLDWFDLKGLNFLITTELKHMKADKSISYFFENRKGIVQLLPSVNLKDSFLIYMRLSKLTPFSLQPLKLENLQPFFEVVGNQPVETLYSQYAIYSRLNLQEKIVLFRKIIEGILKIFMSYTQFYSNYLNKIQKTDWVLLISLIKKWDLEAENVTQEELFFLIRIGYQLPENIMIPLSSLSNLESGEKGCRLLNKTMYPNWVFVLFCLQKISRSLSGEWRVSKKKDRIVFQSSNYIGDRLCSLVIFDIQLCKDGIEFVGESVNSIASFYTQFEPRNCSDSSQISLFFRKRKGENIETESTLAKVIKLSVDTGEQPQRVDDEPTDKTVMSTQIDDIFMLLPSEFEDQDLSLFSPVTSDRFFDLFEQDFELEFV